MTENRAPRAHELRMRRWQQQFDATALADIDAELQQQLAALWQPIQRRYARGCGLRSLVVHAALLICCAC